MDGERIRVLEGLGQPDLTDFDVPAPFATDVSRNVMRLAGGYKWPHPAARAAFETCAGAAVSGCLNLTQPVGERVDPAFRSMLLGVGVGLALAKGGGYIALGLAGWWLLKGRGIAL